MNRSLASERGGSEVRIELFHLHETPPATDFRERATEDPAHSKCPRHRDRCEQGADALRLCASEHTKPEPAVVHAQDGMVLAVDVVTFAEKTSVHAHRGFRESSFHIPQDAAAPSSLPGPSGGESDVVLEDVTPFHEPCGELLDDTGCALLELGRGEDVPLQVDVGEEIQLGKELCRAEELEEVTSGLTVPVVVPLVEGPLLRAEVPVAVIIDAKL